MSQRNLVQSNQRMFAIVEGLQELGEAGVTELASFLDMNKSSVHKHLKTLEKEGYVINTSGKYRMSFKFLYHGGSIRDQNKLCRLARDKVNEVALETEEPVTFSAKNYERGVVVYLRNDHYGLRSTLHLGCRFYLHQNAAGKAILSQLSDEEIESIIEETGLPKTTENTVTSEEELFDELDHIRKRGYSVAFEEQIEGAQAVSAAACDPETQTLGALTLYFPLGGRDDDRTERYGNIVRTATSELELQVKYK